MNDKMRYTGVQELFTMQTIDWIDDSLEKALEGHGITVGRLSTPRRYDAGVWFELIGKRVELWKVDDYFIDQCIERNLTDWFPYHTSEEMKDHYRNKLDADCMKLAQVGVHTLCLAVDVHKAFPKEMFTDVLERVCYVVGGYMYSGDEERENIPSTLFPQASDWRDCPYLYKEDIGPVMWDGVWEKWLKV